MSQQSASPADTSSLRFFSTAAQYGITEPVYVKFESGPRRVIEMPSTQVLALMNLGIQFELEDLAETEVGSKHLVVVMKVGIAKLTATKWDETPVRGRRIW